MLSATQAIETAEPHVPTAAPGEPSENATPLHYSSDPPSSYVLQASAAILWTTRPVCHATPYASCQKLNTDIGIIQLATRISGSGIQCRPRMTTQGHNLDVRTRQLSQDSSFRADHDSGSSGLSTPTSSRSLGPIVYTLWRWLLLHIRICDRHRRTGERTRTRESTADSGGPVLLVWLGWGRAPSGGGTTAALPCSAHLFRLRKLPFVLAVCACTPTRNKHQASHPVAPPTKGTRP